MFKPKAAKVAELEQAIKEALGAPIWLELVRVTTEGQATLVLKADPDDMKTAESRRIMAESAARSVRGITDVNVGLTAEKPAGSPAQPVPAKPKRPAPDIAKSSVRRVRKGARLSDEALKQPAPTKAAPSNIAGISQIIAVSSAKGGVGKSTVAVNLAIALQKSGRSVGILDADIYGPSIPTMLGTVDAEPRTGNDKKLLPVDALGLKSLSIGYLADQDAPMIWRGPIVMSAITQMLNDAKWGTEAEPLDVLIIDTPPGTGDAALTLAQRVPLTAAIIVTTPQEVALADVRRGAAMFAKTAVPVLGIVETMSWFEDPTGNRHDLFGSGGGKNMADALGLPLLMEIPLLTSIREGGDIGMPAAAGTGQAVELFSKLAATVMDRLDNLQTNPPPEIIFVD
ncbi:MAG: Mrp/NBP35 family ATP-binding protein [Hyphomonadaceae bacterium]